jgi:SAM-dependent methyltransferase
LNPSGRVAPRGEPVAGPEEALPDITGAAEEALPEITSAATTRHEPEKPTVHGRGASTRRRAAGFLRNLSHVQRRVGTGGVVELIAARAFPWASYQRVAIIEGTISVGRLHPELRPQRVRSLEPDIERFHARLAESGEPEVPAFMPQVLNQRFAAGHELWVFREGDQIAHAKWVVSDCLRFANRSLPLRPDERVLEAGVTLPEFRRRGINGRARAHVAKVLDSEGVTRVLGAINGFNRRLFATSLKLSGTRHAATIHAISLGTKRWLRAVPATPDHAAMLEGRGLPIGRWLREPPATQHSLVRRWDDAAARVLSRPYLDERMADRKRAAHLALLDRWLPNLHGRSVLKTDLWEEGVAGEELLFSLGRRAGSAYGIDISPLTVTSANEVAARSGAPVDVRVADIRELPYADGEVDVIVSTSTLDHLTEPDQARALAEMRRVLSPAGCLVVTVDNRENLGDPLLRSVARLGLVPFPLESSLTRCELEELVRRAGFVPHDHAYLVHGPRVLTTVCVRAARALWPRPSTRGVDWLLRTLDAVGRRAPVRMGAFVAVAARPADVGGSRA